MRRNHTQRNSHLIQSVYLIGSLRNPKIPEIGNDLRSHGFNLFSDWYAAGPRADDHWQEYEIGRGNNFREALKERAATNVFRFDQQNLIRCDAAVLVLPAGKSGHMELGYVIGLGKPGFILLDNVDRWDVMYRFANEVCYSVEGLAQCLRSHSSR